MHLDPIGRVSLAIRRPDLLLRKLRGLSVTHISPKEISRFLESPGTIVEAGAFDGRDTLSLAKQWPLADVHAFEPIPEAFGSLTTCTRHLSRVTCYQLALSDRSGHQDIHVSSSAAQGLHSDASSLLRPTGHLELLPGVSYNTRISVQTITLDDWATAVGVSSVDLLWLDLQGMELQVLEASPTVVSNCRAIMLEISRRHLYEGAPLQPEVVSWLHSQGFREVLNRVSLYFGNSLFTKRT